MAGTVTVSELGFPDVLPGWQAGPLKRIKWSWTSNAFGDANHTTSELYSGIVAAITTDPGTPAPTALYDINITDADGLGIIGNTAGVNLSATATATTKDDATFRYFGPSTISLTVINAGDSKQGDIYLWIKVP